MKAPHPLKPDGKNWDREKVFEIVLERLATMSIPEALQAGWEGRGLPGAPLFGNWLSGNPQWQEAVAHARKARAAHLVEEAMRLADEPPERAKDGRIDNGHVRWVEQRINQRRWVAERLDRANWGQQVQVDMNVHGAIDIGQVLAEARGRALTGRVVDGEVLSSQSADSDTQDTDISDLLE